MGGCFQEIIHHDYSKRKQRWSYQVDVVLQPLHISPLSGFPGPDRLADLVDHKSTDTDGYREKCETDRSTASCMQTLICLQPKASYTFYSLVPWLLAVTSLDGSGIHSRWRCNLSACVWQLTFHLNRYHQHTDGSVCIQYRIHVLMMACFDFPLLFACKRTTKSPEGNNEIEMNKFQENRLVHLVWK